MGRSWGSAPILALCSEVNVARPEIAHGFVGTTDGVPRWNTLQKTGDSVAITRNKVADSINSSYECYIMSTSFQSPNYL